MGAYTDCGRVCNGENIKEHHPEEMNASNWGRVGPLLFLAVRKRRPRHPLLTQESGAAGNDSQCLRRVRPLVAGGTPCRPFLLLADDRTRNGPHHLF